MRSCLCVVVKDMNIKVFNLFSQELMKEDMYLGMRLVHLNVD